MRERLDNRRFAESFDVVHPRGLGKVYAVTAGVRPDGRIAEVFIASYGKVGSDADTAGRDAAVLISLALQHGAGLDDLLGAITRDSEGDVEGLAGLVLEQLARRQAAIFGELQS